MVDYNKLDKILKIILLICFIALFFTMRIYKLDSCDLIKDKTEGLNQGQVVSLYYVKCLEQYKITLETKNYSNFTLIKP